MTWNLTNTDTWIPTTSNPGRHPEAPDQEEVLEHYMDCIKDGTYTPALIESVERIAKSLLNDKWSKDLAKEALALTKNLNSKGE